MAAYTDIKDVGLDPVFQDKVLVATYVLASDILSDSTSPSNQANRLKLATKILQNPLGWRDYIIGTVLAANKAATKSAILTASDATIQDNVNALKDVLADNIANFTG